ncbi:relaxase/mobilization nuclease domain-containing protein [Komagataeibacter sp. FXV3]|uniref:relaxase/mobilization nuclease domain-containing protein n=1 Tax=Komagataeibacter sp. FXV3 TaxID=2608998 RepID=UPI00187B6921|nr:hypothetical protein [Komagataeibacter sp. FXV3]MBE7729843.1 hypothetical protein [Komagataeibacter sp. FXV3]
MIIKGHGIGSSSDIKKFTDYLFTHEKNEQINILNGSPDAIRSMFRDAHGAGLKYGCQHFIMSSKEQMTQEQALSIIKGQICKEYNQDYDNLVIVNHTKQRNTHDSDKNHYHIILPHCDPVTGKAINLKNSKRRNEKISRLAEIELGHALVKGRHNTAVFRQLIKEGRQEQAQAIKPLMEGDLPQSAYSKKTQQKAEKQGLNIGEAKAHIKTTYQHSDSLSVFLKNLEGQGYTFKAGDKADTYIIEKDKILIGSANRLIGIKKPEFQKLYNQHLQQEIKENDRTTAENKHSNRNIQTSPEISQKHEPDNRVIARDTSRGGNVTLGADTGTTEHDSTATDANHNDTIASTEINKSNASRYKKLEEIKINRQLKNIKIYNYPNIKIIDDDYINNIKLMLKNQRKEDYKKIRSAYINMRYQKYYFNSSDKTYNSSILNIMYDCFSRLFKFQKKSHKSTDMIKPDVKPPLEKHQWQKLTSGQQSSLRYACLYHYQKTFENLLEYNKINNINNNLSFQSFLNILKNTGDFMAVEISNLYPYEYIKRLDDEYLKNELTKIMKNLNSSSRYTREDIKENIVLVCENLIIDKDIKEKNQEMQKIKADIERMKSINEPDEEREERTIRMR